MSNLYARLPRRLRAFAESSTASESEGRLEPGRYKVLEQIEGTDTDYARVVALDLAESDTWICTRWKDQHYATFEEEIERVAPEAFDWTGDDLAIPESALVALLPEFHHYSYTPRGARYPYPVDGISLPQGPPNENNCCTFVEALVVGAWQSVHGANARWSRRLHNLIMITTSDLFGPITAIAEAGFGVEIADPDAPPRPWTAVQGWTRGNAGGHTFFILDYHAETDRVLTLESNSAYDLDGVGFRKIGNLSTQPEGRPPNNWWTNDRLQTWEDVCGNYVSRESAALKVSDIGWARQTN